jgi:molybdate transport system ATP-binding protein
LVCRPRLLLLDEPLSALDLPTREQLRHELRHWLTKLAVPGIVVTHDHVETLALGDHVIVMDHGCVRQSGPPQDVFSAPVDLAVARIVGVDNIESGKVIRMTDGLASVQVGPSELLALSASSVSGQVCVCIRAEDVMLEKGAVARQSSARNHLVGRIRSLDREGPMVRVGIDCGFSLKALVTYQACEDMGLRDGMEVTALVKAPAIRLIPRE